MIPAQAVDWIDADTAAGAALDQVVSHPRSRYPVAAGSPGHLVGVVHVRELVAVARAHPACRTWSRSTAR